MKDKVRESDILYRLRAALVDELARQGQTGRVRILVPTATKREDEW